MTIKILTDVSGASVGINPDQVQGITVAPGVVPASCFVRTSAESFVIPGTPSAVAAALVGYGASTIVASVRSVDGVILNQNAAAEAAGLTVTHTGTGDNTVHLATALGKVSEIAISLTGLAKESVSLGTFTVSAFQVLGWDAAGVAADVNFLIVISPTA